MNATGTLATIEHINMRLRWAIDNPGWIESVLPQGIEPATTFAAPPFCVSLLGEAHPLFYLQQSGTRINDLDFELKKMEVGNGAWDLVYQKKDGTLEVQCRIRCVAGVNVLLQSNTVTNIGERAVVLTHFASGVMNGITGSTSGHWDVPGRLVVHYCRQAWEGEGQWVHGGVAELGIRHTSVHPNTTAFHLHSSGGFSTATYLPILLVEDTWLETIHFIQIETSSAWHLEFGFRADWTGKLGATYLLADGAHEPTSGWARTLNPGESMETAPMAFGCVAGGFDAAIGELTRYRRACLKPTRCTVPPLVFNDYMNALWGNPTRESLQPLIEAAAKVGAEIFTIDAGWFTPRSATWGHGLGDWEPSADRFGAEGLAGVVDLIRSHGMRAGIWLEWEVCGADAKLAAQPDDWFLRRHGRRIGGGARWFLDLRNSAVREYLHRRIDALMELGVSYIKNDYNDDLGPGDDTWTESAAEGLRQHVAALYGFIDEVRARHHELILENCASGACRADYGILSRFDLQSVSDQEVYRRNPSIVMGMMAGVVPEQLGIWAYPYPALYLEKDVAGLVGSAEWRARFTDGEETIFNLVSGLCGVLYLSGRIDLADERNLRLIREAGEVFKAERGRLAGAVAVWPLGRLGFEEQAAWGALGLYEEATRRLRLAVWRIGADNSRCTLQLGRWVVASAKCRQAFPAEEYHVGVDLKHDGAFTVELPQPFQARMFVFEA